MPGSNPHPLSRPGGRSMRHFFRELFRSISDDDIFNRSAELGYYFFFAIFPGFIFLSTVVAIFFGSSAGMRATLTQHLAQVVPPHAFALLQQTLSRSTGATGRLTFGVVVSLWSATVGMSAACDTLNAVHDVTESRPWWKVKLVALLLTLITTVLVLCAVGVLFGGDAMIRAAGIGGAFDILVKIGQWAVAFVFVTLIFSITYYFAPDVKDREWHWITPGASLGIVLWILATLALRFYLHYSDTYSATYGTMGAVMVLLLWFYIAGFALLTGAEINAVIEDTAAHQGDPEAVAKGEKSPQAAA